MRTDACVLVNKDGSATPRRLILTGKSCGFSRMILCGTADLPTSYVGVTVLRGKIIGRVTGKPFLDAVRTAPEGTVVFVQAGDNAFNRTAITTKGVHLLTGIVDLPKGGFDHIVAKMAAQHTTGVVIDLACIVSAKTRRAALARYAEILMLHRKFGFPLVIASGADDIFGIRNVVEMTALCSLFGMTRDEVDTALTALDRVLSPPTPVTIVEAGR